MKSPAPVSLVGAMLRLRPGAEIRQPPTTQSGSGVSSGLEV